MKLTKVKDLILDKKYQVMPPMSSEDRKVLTDEIRKHGVQVNIEIDENMHVLDGHNRVEICRELGIEEVPTSMKIGMTENQKLMHARALNLARRHLTTEQRHNLINAQLKETPERSNRQIAKNLGVSDKTVGVQRKELEHRAEIPHISTIKDTIGREQPREKKSTSRYSPEEIERAMNALEGFNNDPFENTHFVSSQPATLYNPSQRDIKAVQNPDIARRVIKNQGDIAGAIREHTRDELVQHLESVEAREAKAIAGVYDVVVIDPPWPMQKIERDNRPLEMNLDYPVMSLEEIKQLHIPVSDDAHIFLWTTQKYLPYAFDVLKAWGFTYVCTFVWHKQGGYQPFDLPAYNCEFCLYAHKGNPKFIDTKAFATCFNAQSTGHSVKPDEFYDTLRRVTAGRRLDMFNRRPIKGFDGWGNEADVSRT